MAGGLVSAGVGPFAQGGLDEAFGFAISAGGIRAGALMANAELATEMAEGEGLVTGAVIGEYALDANAELLIVGDGGGQEGGGRGTFLIGQDLGEGETGVIVDSDMHIIPAQAAGATAEIAMNAGADLAESAQLLDVEVKQIAWGGVLITTNGRGGFEVAQTVEMEPAQDAADGSWAESGMSGDAACGPALATKGNDLLDEGSWGRPT